MERERRQTLFMHFVSWKEKIDMNKLLLVLCVFVLVICVYASKESDILVKNAAELTDADCAGVSEESCKSCESLGGEVHQHHHFHAHCCCCEKRGITFGGKRFLPPSPKKAAKKVISKIAGAGKPKHKEAGKTAAKVVKKVVSTVGDPHKPSHEKAAKTAAKVVKDAVTKSGGKVPSSTTASKTAGKVVKKIVETMSKGKKAAESKPAAKTAAKVVKKAVDAIKGKKEGGGGCKSKKATADKAAKTAAKKVMEHKIAGK